MKPMCCPSCKTNRSRFNVIEQSAKAVKLHPQTGEIEREYEEGQLEPFHLPYTGPKLRIQCAACGVIESEESFAKWAVL